jgi:hypothetical protein
MPTRKKFRRNNRNKNKSRRKRQRGGGGLFDRRTYYTEKGKKGMVSREKMQERKFSGKPGFLSPKAHLSMIGRQGDCALMYGQRSSAMKRAKEEAGITTSKIRKYDGRTGLQSSSHGMTQLRFNAGCNKGQGEKFLRKQFKQWANDAKDYPKPGYGKAKIKELNKMATSKPKLKVTVDNLKNGKKKYAKLLEKYKYTNNLIQRANFLALNPDSLLSNIQGDCGQFKSEGRPGDLYKGKECDKGNPLKNTNNYPYKSPYGSYYIKPWLIKGGKKRRRKRRTRRGGKSRRKRRKTRRRRRRRR